MKPDLHLVPPPDPAPVDITLQMRAEIKARDWGRVHVEADRRAPIQVRIRRWFWSSPSKGARGDA